MKHHPRSHRRLEAKAIAASPPSLALEGVRRYFRSRGNSIALSVPLNEMGMPSAVNLARRVRVGFASHPNRSFIGRRHDRLDLEWYPDPSGPFPTFHGVLTILPLGTVTELVLSGSYDPPFGTLGAAFDAVIGKRAAEATARALLADVVSVLEAEYATLKDLIAPRSG